MVWCENLSLIPGEVGASAVQNIGAYGVEVKDLITSVETINMAGEKRIYGVDECGYSYRKSLFKQPEMKTVFVTYVNFCLGKREHYTLGYGTIQQELEKYPGAEFGNFAPGDYRHPSKQIARSEGAGQCG